MVLHGRETATRLLQRWHLTKPMEPTALLPFFSLYLDFSMDVMRGIGEAWSARFVSRALKSTPDGRRPAFEYELEFDPSLQPHERRLRLGFVSGDVCLDPPEHHPVGKAMRHVWSSFDRSRVDVVLFCHVMKDPENNFATKMAQNEIIVVPLYQPDGNLMSDMQVRVVPPSRARALLRTSAARSRGLVRARAPLRPSHCARVSWGLSPLVLVPPAAFLLPSSRCASAGGHRHQRHGAARARRPPRSLGAHPPDHVLPAAGGGADLVHGLRRGDRRKLHRLHRCRPCRRCARVPTVSHSHAACASCEWIAPEVSRCSVRSRALLGAVPTAWSWID